MSTTPSACERLAQSRERLRQVLGQGVGSLRDPGASAAAGAPRRLAGTPDQPAGHVLTELLLTWWRKQPAQVVLMLVMQAATAVLQPTAQRHPYRLVLGAAALGGTVMLLRPWRWISGTAILAALLPRILSETRKLLPTRATPASKSFNDAAL